jgi:hypothetical protein
VWTGEPKAQVILWLPQILALAVALAVVVESCIQGL